MNGKGPECRARLEKRGACVLSQDPKTKDLLKQPKASPELKSLRLASSQTRTVALYTTPAPYTD